MSIKSFYHNRHVCGYKEYRSSLVQGNVLIFTFIYLQAIEAWEYGSCLVLKREAYVAQLENFERQASDPNRFFEKGNHYIDDDDPFFLGAGMTYVFFN